MRIGVPKEIKNHEYRVALTPPSAAELVAAGHEVFVQTGAGGGIDFEDADYQAVGARIVGTARTLRYERLGLYQSDPFWPGGMFYGSRWRGGYGGGFGYAWGAPSLYYVNEVSLMILDNRTQKVLYETRAQHDGPWADAAVRTALFEAALHDFPRPAVNPRRVVVELPPR